MHYYQFNIADYRKDTVHLSRLEHGIYRDLIDWYYLDETPIPLETQSVMRRLRLVSEEEAKALENVLCDFFTKADGYRHNRIDLDIAEYHAMAEKNKANGKLGGRPKKTQSVTNGLPDESQNNPNQEPITSNQQQPHVADKSATVQQIAQVKPPCPADTIIALYHELMPLNPTVKVLNEARRKTIRARWKEASELDCAPFGYTDREGGIAAWRQFFEVCAESDFLTGKAPAQQGKPPFIADIDFLMSPSGFTKCLENKYHREAA